MLIRNIWFLFILIFFIGCGNKNYLMPGQEHSDCEIADDNNGVCGLPLNLYKFRAKIQQLPQHPGSIYSINDNGVIHDKETGEIIDVEKKIEEAQKKKQENNSETLSNNRIILQKKRYYSKKELRKLLNLKKDTLLNNQSMVIEHPSKMTNIRDLGFVQKVWIAPYSSMRGTLVSAHDIFVVIKKPKWIVGESKPKRIENGRIYPSLIVSDVLQSSHKQVKIQNKKGITDYLDPKTNQDEYQRNISFIQNYLKSTNKGE